jgi:hypothetical protein
MRYGAVRLPRVRIWFLMLVVALAALGSAGWVLLKRSREYTELASMHRSIEKAHLWDATTMEQIAADIQKTVETNLIAAQAIERDTLVPNGIERLDRIEARRAQYAPVVRDYEQSAAESRREARLERALAAAFDRAARYPWLGAPRIGPAK